MFYLLGKDCYIRTIGEYGYVKSSGLFNDLVFDKSGQIFLSALSRIPKSLETLAEEIAAHFMDVKGEEILGDIKEFFDALVDDGYVVCGETERETVERNIGFKYADVSQMGPGQDYTPRNIRSDRDSQVMLDEYFLKNPYLSNFQIELTSRCNERCVHCYITHEYKNTDLSEKLYYSVLEQIKEMGTLGVTLSGGEPMVHPKFKEFLKAAKDRDFYVHVLTNLTLLDDETVRIMRDGNTCGIQASLYSMIPEHHDAITTVKGSFEKTKNNILTLIENNIPVQINCPVMKANRDDVADVLRWGHQHKIRVNIDYAIMAEYDHQTSNLINRLSPEECRGVIRSILAYDESYRTSIEEIKDTVVGEINVEDENDPLCGVGINTACMVANGNVYPCPGWQGYICGNLYQDTMREIWFHSPRMQYLRSLKKKDLKKCTGCTEKAFCSPCLGRFANESPSGDPLEVATHFCKVARVNREVVTEYLHQNK